MVKRKGYMRKQLPLNQFIYAIIWESWFSPKSDILIEIYILNIKSHLLPKNKMVRMIHTTNFYEISLQISDPTVRNLTKTHISEKMVCSKLWKVPSFFEKKTLCGGSTARQRFQTHPGLSPTQMGPNYIQK